jgi:release factor glutamine methyltransferase
MTIQDALQSTQKALESAGIPDAQIDAEYLVAEAVGLPRLKLALNRDKEISVDAHRRLQKWTRERLERRPLAYVLGEQPFMNMNLRVNPSVLIPRPETELLVEEAYKVLDTTSKAIVADIGTGSGNIALSLARHTNVIEVHAVDISAAALEVALENAMHNPVKASVQWHWGDLLTPLIKAELSFDLIVANLPYVRTEEFSSLSPEVRWEPALALDGGHDGLMYIDPLIEQAERVLKPEGMLMLEIGAEQGHAVLDIFEHRRGWKEYHVLQDLAGLPRIIKAKKGALVGSLNY